MLAAPQEARLPFIIGIHKREACCVGHRSTLWIHTIPYLNSSLRKSCGCSKISTAGASVSPEKKTVKEKKTKQLPCFAACISAKTMQPGGDSLLPVETQLNGKNVFGSHTAEAPTDTWPAARTSDKHQNRARPLHRSSLITHTRPYLYPFPNIRHS